MEKVTFFSYRVTVTLTVTARQPMEAHTVAQCMLCDATRDSVGVRLLHIGDIELDDTPLRRASDQRDFSQVQRNAADLVQVGAA